MDQDRGNQETGPLTEFVTVHTDKLKKEQLKEMIKSPRLTLTFMLLMSKLLTTTVCKLAHVTM